MPEYEYTCDKCGNTTTIFKKTFDITAPLCCNVEMRRIWSEPAIKFVGEGFYKNDSRGEK